MCGVVNNTFLTFSSMLKMSPPHTHTAVAIGQNQPLLQEPVVWTSEMPLTEGQLRGKRDTFWETAPAYEGRKEIWDALRAAVEAAEQEDYDLAQAILNGASISLPTGGHAIHNLCKSQ